MKKMMLLAFLALFGVSIASAALTAKDLTPKAIRTAIAAKPTAQRQEYAAQMISAVAAIPQDEEARTQALTSTARALIAGARTGGGMGVIAEIFNTVPVANLQGVADLLARNNFGQKLNGMTDEQYDTFAARVVSSSARYIQASGTDSPTLRISILVATFAKASSDQDRTRQKLIAALPTAMQEAAKAFILASEANDVDVIAAAAGVDEVAPTPEDPDAEDVVQEKQEAEADAAKEEVKEEPKTDDTAAVATVADEDEGATDEPADAGVATVSEDDLTASTSETEPAEEEPAAEPADEVTPAEAAVEDVTDVPAEDDVADEGDDQAPVVTDIDPASDPEAKVPLIARMAEDVLGQTIDVMNSTRYEWDTIAPEHRFDDPIVPTLPGMDNVTDVPGEAVVTTPIAPSVPYGNQETY